VLLAQTDRAWNLPVGSRISSKQLDAAARKGWGHVTGQEVPPQTLGDFPLLASRFSNGSSLGSGRRLSGSPERPTLVPEPDTSGGIVYDGGTL